MLKRVRQLRISLAAKCQLLFGVAVVLIIAAALVVPWLRMEKLVEQIDERAARLLAERSKVEHLRRVDAPVGTAETAEARTPGSSPVSATTAPATSPSSLLIDNTLVKWVPVSALSNPKNLSRFEQRAFVDFAEASPRGFFYRRYARDDGETGYRFALPLTLEPACLRCHTSAELREGSVRVADETLSNNSPAATTTRVALIDAVRADLVGLIRVDIPSQSDTRQELLNRVFILAAGMLAGTLAILVFYLITTRLILEPVRVLQETAEKVSEGDLDIRSDINTGDEFQQLSETFNGMLTNLKSSADQLRAINKSLDLRLGQLAESNVALYESNRLKSEFLANVSHELRTPLNSILGFAELLKEGATAPDPRTQRYLANILNSGKNLLELINDLLDLAKIEAGRMDVRSEPLSVHDLFEGLGNVMKPLLEPKKLTITMHIAPGVPIIATDALKLQQILYNFLSNAIKFSPQDAVVELSAEPWEGSRVRISVKDHGPGIAAEQHAVIFEKFRQIDGSVTKEHSGTGLGLAISRELCTLLSGTIGVESTPGAGAEFWLIFPTEIQPAHADVRSKLVLSA